jgi:hypothetical protein
METDKDAQLAASEIEPLSVKASFNLPADELAALKELAKQRRVSVTQALRQAIADSKFIEDQMTANNQLVVERPDGSRSDIVIHR